MPKIVRVRKGHIIIGHGPDCNQYSSVMMKRVRSCSGKALLMETKVENHSANLKDSFRKGRKGKSCKLVYQCLVGGFFNEQEMNGEDWARCGNIS